MPEKGSLYAKSISATVSTNVTLRRAALDVHCPNGGKRDASTGGQTRALGVKPGVPDLLMLVVSGPDCGLVLEFKGATGRMGPEQNEWADHPTVRSADAACAAVMHYLDVELPPL